MEKGLERNAKAEGLKLRVNIQDRNFDPRPSYKNYLSYIIKSDFDIPKPLLEELDEDEFYGIWYHALGLIKGLYDRVIVIWTILVLMIISLEFLIGSFLPSLLPGWHAIASVSMAFGFPVLMLRYLEYRADEYASSKVGPKPLIRALKKMEQISGKSSFIRPSIRERVEKIQQSAN